MFYFVINLLVEFFTKIHCPLFWARIIASIIVIIGLLLVWFILSYVLKKIFFSVAKKIGHKKKSLWIQELLKEKIFTYFASVLVTFLLQKMISQFFPIGTKTEIFFLSAVNIGLIVNFALIINSFFKSLTNILLQKEATKDKPMKSYFQVIMIIIWTLASILIISIILNKSPAGLLAGIGAFSAVLLLVFQDTIVGFINSIQLSNNDLVRNGDWITMDKYKADGEVEEINLTSVKIRNFDNTITTIPVKQMISDSFQNWRGIEQKGLRRIKRSLLIDINSLKTCTQEMIESYKKIPLITKDIENIVNFTDYTNFAILRLYLLSYLKNHPMISNEVTTLVRQLSPNEYGLRIEIYCFTTTTNWSIYEDIQSEIFEHFYSILPLFEVNAFQRK
ncbi:MAG: mechanosensitive ion channel family protein [Bacteroidales bacterium]|jgi:miniconductance mechanosensitive channel|nr:mechanosensitive ion channel family protein [Bacteroidales bacterium]